MRSELPFVSIVVPTHNRRAILLQCLAALQTQDYPGRMEVIVVADGCTDDTVETLADLSSESALLVISQPSSGAAAARNRGAAEANGELLLFLDDDVVAYPALVRAHVEVHQNRKNCVVVGPYLMDRPVRTDYTTDAIYRFWRGTFDRLADPARSPTFGDVLSGNLSMWLSTFQELGGFDDAFPECGIEDYEFGVRVLRAKVPVLFAPLAKARHMETTDLRRLLSRKRREGSSMIVLARLHPWMLQETRLLQNAWLAHWLVFRVPLVGERIAELNYHVLVMAQQLRLRYFWLTLFKHLRTYWFWRGVKDQVGNIEMLRVELRQLKRMEIEHGVRANANTRVNSDH